MELKTRLDKLLSAQNPDRTRAYLQKIIKSGCVLVNGKPATKSGFLVKDSDKVEVSFPELKKIEAKAVDIKISVIYEDDDIIVIDKAAGIVVHPSDTGGHSEYSIVNAVLYHCGDALKGISGELRPGIVHRLDKDTSGVLIVAKSDDAMQSLMKQFSERTVSKEYIALVKGRIVPDHAIIDSPIGRSTKDRKKMAITDEAHGRNSVTEYSTEQVYEDNTGSYSLVRAFPKTGRTHQIRVHLNAVGYPVVGDIQYGDTETNRHFSEKYRLKRQFLHAAKLTINHPVTGKKLSFESKLPKELQGVLEAVSANAPATR